MSVGVDAAAGAPSFELSDTERMVRDTARDALASFGDNAALVALESSPLGYDPSVWERIVSLGWPGFAVPASAGGAGGSMVDAGLLMEEVGYAAYPSPLLQCTSAAVLLDALAPSSALLAEIALGRIVVPVVPLGDTLVNIVDGRLELDGALVIAEWGASAEWLVVLARDASGGWVLVSVPASELGDRVSAALSLDNERLGVLALDGLSVSPLVESISPGDAADAVARLRLLRASEMAGGGIRVLELTRDYMLDRHQFGVPLGSFQAVQHHLANMRIDVDAALLCAREGCSLAALDKPLEAAAAIAGYVAGRSYTRVTITAAQLFAGVGVTKEHRLHHYFRRAKAMQLRLGSVAGQLERIASAAVQGPAPGPWGAFSSNPVQI